MTSLMSPSFPYFWISKKLLLDYWVVLSYSDAENKEPSIWSATERAAVEIIDNLPSAILLHFEELMTEARMRRTGGI